MISIRSEWNFQSSVQAADSRKTESLLFLKYFKERFINYIENNIYFVEIIYEKKNTLTYTFINSHSAFSIRSIELIKESTNDCEKGYPANCKFVVSRILCLPYCQLIYLNIIEMIFSVETKTNKI